MSTISHFRAPVAPRATGDIRVVPVSPQPKGAGDIRVVPNAEPSRTGDIRVVPVPPQPKGAGDIRVVPVPPQPTPIGPTVKAASFLPSVRC